MGQLTLKVEASKYPGAADRDDPSTIREVGFKVTTTLSSDTAAFSTLQEKYKLEQWVTDKYWLRTREQDTSTAWVDGNWETTRWERDQFGGDNDRGEWDSDKNTTTFLDEPGFLGTRGLHARALDKTQQLGDYEISFKWKIYDGARLLKETEVITLKAEPNDNDDIIYTSNVSRQWIVTV